MSRASPFALWTSQIVRVLNVAAYALSSVAPRDLQTLIFGAWSGSRFADNPKYLLLHLARTRPDLDLVWIGNEAVRTQVPALPSVRFVRRGTWRASLELMRAGFCFVSHSHLDLAPYNLLGGASRVYLGHGLALKHMGTREEAAGNFVARAAKRLLRAANSFSWFVATSKAHEEKLLLEYAIQAATPGRILRTGQPRNDLLLNPQDQAQGDASRASLFNLRPTKPSQRLVSYLPTFRDNLTREFSFHSLDGERRQQAEALLESHGALLLEKGHHADSMQVNESAGTAESRIVAVAKDFPGDTQELLLASDALITDYSGVYLDFLLLDRPILHFAYDREYYLTKDRGLYFDLDDVAGGPVVETFEDLMRALDAALREPHTGAPRRQELRQRLMGYERGTACEQIAQQLLSRRKGKGEELRGKG